MLLSPKPLIHKGMPVSDDLLNLLVYLPTSAISKIFDEEIFLSWSDQDFMRLAVLLAFKSYNEGGCPIGGVIVDNQSRKVIGKGHNTLVQENDPYNHGETSAIRDAGRCDFSKTTLFTTLSPCDVCASLVYMRGFPRVVVGDVTSANGNEDFLRSKGIRVDILEDREGIALYHRYRSEKPHLDLEDWKGLSAVSSG